MPPRLRPNALCSAPASLGRLAALAILLAASSGRSATDAKLEYNRDVRPILSDKCFKCHGPDAQARKAELRLDVRESALALHDGVPPLVPGKPEQSEVVRRIETADPEDHMPPLKSNLRLSKDEAAVLRRWIAEGAEYQPHWSLIPPKAAPPPEVKMAGWPRNEIDRFVLGRLEREGLAPSPEADRVTLLRRVTLDLTGLPPTPEEVEAFVRESEAEDAKARGGGAAGPGASSAYGRVVERLLSSPRYGERMAMDWLDAARYADTNGFYRDNERHIWPWRDWVIAAFNRNLPFNQFTVEQLAGDLLPGATMDQKIATGFNRNHMVTNEPGAIDEEYRVQYVTDRLETTATVWMGLTVGCARCHDHKFDSLSQREYYQLFAFFNNVPETGFVSVDDPPPVLDVASAEQHAELEKLSTARRDAQTAFDQLRAVLAMPAGKRDAKQTKQLLEYLAAQRAGPDKPGPQFAVQAARAREDAFREKMPKTLVMEELPAPRTAHLLKRGKYDEPGEEVRAGVPACLPPLPAGAPRNRLGLARWLVSPDHPLTARVAVNRLWQQFFGEGLVRTINDFGVQGEPPTHPELLDWLAVRFMQSGWDVKEMLRLIVTSATYRQSSSPSAALLQRDPENRLLARGPSFRLPAEIIRDQALAASGLLVERIGGPSVKPYQPPGLWEAVSYNGELTYREDQGESLWRRSLYTFVKRQSLAPGAAAFDAPTRETCVVQRSRTNTPLQALVLLNDATYVEAGRALAARALAQPGDDAARLRLAFSRATSRPPDEEELGTLRRLLDQQRARFRQNPDAARKLIGTGASPAGRGLEPVELAAWSVTAQALLNLDEVITRQ
jgi:Protein of unknown function (DUF1553)/Protein of unknown function (DUF1549)/Planctomycete cytochrome C